MQDALNKTVVNRMILTDTFAKLSRQKQLLGCYALMEHSEQDFSSEVGGLDRNPNYKSIILTVKEQNLEQMLQNNPYI